MFDVIANKKGLWIVEELPEKEQYKVSCSCCKSYSIVSQRDIWEATFIGVFNICPMCGADMRGDKDDQSR